MKVDRILLIHLAILGGIVLLSAGTAHAAPVQARMGELVNMVRQDCGSCHGMTLKGGLGPSLLPETLAGKADESLVLTIMSGRPGTAMPGWARFMSEDEAEWIVSRLKEGFPQLAQQGGGQ